MTAIADGRPAGRDGTARALPTSGGAGTAIAQLREDWDRWDLAWAALDRRDYPEFDRITGFQMPNGE